MVCKTCNDTGTVLRVIDPPKWSLVGSIDNEYIPCIDCGVFEADMVKAKETMRAYFTNKAAERGETYEEYCKRRFGSVNGENKA